MTSNFPRIQKSRLSVLCLLSILILFAGVISAAAASTLQISADTYTNPNSQHATQVEPDSFAYGSTIVMVAQSGRFFDGGASNIAWSTSTDGGQTWTKGNLPGITRHENPSNPWDRASDPVVAYSARDNVWLVSSLGISEAPAFVGDAVLTSRSTDGGLTWGPPVVTGEGVFVDKNWIACDNWPSSPFYGNCYTQWDDAGEGGVIYMSASSDGGLTWGPRTPTADSATGIGGQPLVQPDGTVIVPILDSFVSNMMAFHSTDGGASWSSPVIIAPVISHRVAGLLRTLPLPSAEVDASGVVYVVWQDCRFRSGCSSNDIVLSTTTDGLIWTPPSRLPIDPVDSPVDHFIPGLGVDPGASGSTARLALTYYYYPEARCGILSCRLNVGFITSPDGGASWSAPMQLNTESMRLPYLPRTSSGFMVGDYISTSFVNGVPLPVVALANPPTLDLRTRIIHYDQAIYTSPGLEVEESVLTIGGEQPVPGAASDYAPSEVPVTIH